jgi:thiol-disulfide isomerase/thioredoxin
LSSRPLRLAYTGFALLGAAVLGAFVYDRAFRPASPAPREAPIAAVRASRPASPTIPARRPQIALKDLAGQVHSIADWDGKALVINFWATWCAPCRREIPLLNRIEREYGPKGFEVVGIAVDFADDVKAFTKDFPIGYPLLIGEEDGLEAARAFGVETMAFPFTAFTDAKGRIITVHMGELQPAQAEAILGVVDRIDRGMLAPDGARAAVTAALDALPSAPRKGATAGVD